MYPSKAQETLLAKAFGCARFIYSRMPAQDRALRENQRNTPAQYKSEFP
ncbi:MAG: helix-turn-helix domain-containing protein [Eubacteriaceae bacterium]|nr:helix-turn-helix domain-containing protein [Eubacteriaceae bacterium]